LSSVHHDLERDAERMVDVRGDLARRVVGHRLIRARWGHRHCLAGREETCEARREQRSASEADVHTRPFGRMGTSQKLIKIS
jgi:hypothetical protein